MIKHCQATLSKFWVFLVQVNMLDDLVHFLTAMTVFICDEHYPSVVQPNQKGVTTDWTSWKVKADCKTESAPLQQPLPSWLRCHDFCKGQLWTGCPFPRLPSVYPNQYQRTCWYCPINSGPLITMGLMVFYSGGSAQSTTAKDIQEHVVGWLSLYSQKYK